MKYVHDFTKTKFPNACGVDEEWLEAVSFLYALLQKSMRNRPVDKSFRAHEDNFDDYF